MLELPLYTILGLTEHKLQIERKFAMVIGPWAKLKTPVGVWISTVFSLIEPLTSGFTRNATSMSCWIKNLAQQMLFLNAETLGLLVLYDFY